MATDKKISELTSYTTPLNADLVPVVDTANTTTKQVSWANIKATLKAYFDTLYQATGSYLTNGGALGTPSSGTLTNTAGLPVAGITSSTSTALGVGSLELGHATDTTLTRVSAGVIAIEGDTVKTLGASQTLTGTNTEKQILWTSNSITASSNAATVPITHRYHKVTNDSAATLTITIAVASATDGQLIMIDIFDFSAVSQTIAWVNTENSSLVSAPLLSNGSTTLPITAGFKFNGATSKWRCIASA